MQIIIKLDDEQANFLMNTSFIPVGYYEILHKALSNAIVLPKCNEKTIETLEKMLICKDNCDESCAIYNSHKGVCDNDIAIKEAIKILKEVDHE